MKLSRVTVHGYRSVSEKVSLVLDPVVTVLLGANDHGKTNLLDAIQLLNPDVGIDPERDLNWDLANDVDYPFVQYEFQLSDDDRQKLLEIAQAMLDEAAASEPKTAVAQTPDPTAIAPALEPSSGDPEAPSEPARAATLTIADLPSVAIGSISGVSKKIVFQKAEKLPNGSVTKFMAANTPRIEIIRSKDTVPDSTTLAALMTDEHEFMRGIFYYAGLEQDEFVGLFAQTDSTLMRLERASEVLNTTLRAHWTQGSDLQFRLVHDSKTDTIALRIKDPSVSDRLVRASQRSSGFTHFFTLKTVLHARQREHPANSYIFLFDEPGVYLHPSGQYDLLQVLDTIGRQNQVVYSTHSLFMLNKSILDDTVSLLRRRQVRRSTASPMRAGGLRPSRHSACRLQAPFCSLSTFCSPKATPTRCTYRPFCRSSSHSAT